MKILKTLGVTWLGFSLVAGLFVYDALALEPIEQVDAPYAYQVLGQSDNLRLDFGAPGWLRVTLRNIGQESWEVSQLRLGAVYLDSTASRVSEFSTSEWENGSLVKPATERSVIEPLEKVTFKIPVQGINEIAKFKEAFRPAIDGNWAEGKPISWLIQVGEDLSAQTAGAEGKRIRVSLDKQHLWAIEDHVVVMSMPVSTGKAGYDTPEGTYTIANHAARAYSAEYKLYMGNWMALAGPNGNKIRGYGVHQLPAWKVNPAKYKNMNGQYIGSRYYEDGWLYEDAAHLGKKMSHGCIRVGIKEAPILYDWAENGTVVQVG
ncbi:L,D-transpeptidase [Patescibacteria group bacterium]|nr:L,D-transpeptidase [Patescibacteria group bacterium]